MDKDILYSVVANRLRKLRKQNGWNQEQLAERLGVTRTSVTNTELGRQHPPLHTLYDYAQVFNVGIGELLPSMGELERSDTITVQVNGENVILADSTKRAIRLALMDEEGEG